MTMRSLLSATHLSATLLMLLSACAGGGGTPGSGDDGSRLVGRTFLSTAVTGRTLVGEAGITLGFPQQGKLTAQAGCNQLFGDVAIEGDRMRVTGMGGTDMGCERSFHEQDEWLTAFLTAGPKFALNGDDLVLTGDKEQIKLVDRKVAEPDRALAGTRWVVESLLDRETASSVPAGVEAFLQFEGDMVTGNAGCNQLSGKAVQQPGAVVFSGIVTTKMACAAERGAVETAVLAVLGGEVSAKVDADVLLLKNTNGKGLQLRSAGEPRPASS